MLEQLVIHGPADRAHLCLPGGLQRSLGQVRCKDCATARAQEREWRDRHLFGARSTCVHRRQVTLHSCNGEVQMTQQKNARRPLIVGKPALIMVDFQRGGPYLPGRENGVLHMDG